GVPLAGLPPRHGAAPHLHHAGGGADPGHGRLPRVRHHLRPHRRRPRHGHPDDPDAELPGVRARPHGPRQLVRDGHARPGGPPVLRADAGDPPSPGAGRERRVRPTPLRRALTAVTLVPVLLWTLFPIYWIATASFKTERSLYARPPQWLFSPILDNYHRV